MNGLVGLGSFLLSLLFLWYLVLLVLKLKGHELGCAGGHAFTTRTSSKAESFTDSDESSSNNKKSENSDDDRFSARFLGGSRRDLPKESSSRGCCPNSGLHVQRRKLRTRMVFLFFAFISLFCSVLIVTRTYHQLQTATDNVSKVIDEGEEIVGSVDSVIEAVGSAIQIADNILETIPLEFAQLCPDVPPEFFKPQLGVDPRDVVSFLDREYNPFIVYAQENMGALQEVTVQFRGILGDIDNVTQESEDRLWVLPMLIMCITIFTVFSAIGTLVAIYREAIAGSKPTPCDKFLSWFILPAMIMWTILAWTLVICFCFGTVLTSDVCVSSGGPDVMIQNILEAHHVDPDTTTFSLIAAYTGVSLRCGVCVFLVTLNI